MVNLHRVLKNNNIKDLTNLTPSTLKLLFAFFSETQLFYQSFHCGVFSDLRNNELTTIPPSWSSLFTSSSTFVSSISTTSVTILSRQHDTNRTFDFSGNPISKLPDEMCQSLRYESSLFVQSFRHNVIDENSLQMLITGTSQHLDWNSFQIAFLHWTTFIHCHLVGTLSHHYQPWEPSCFCLPSISQVFHAKLWGMLMNFYGNRNLTRNHFSELPYTKPLSSLQFLFVSFKNNTIPCLFFKVIFGSVLQRCLTQSYQWDPWRHQRMVRTPGFHWQQPDIYPRQDVALCSLNIKIFLWQ